MSFLSRVIDLIAPFPAKRGDQSEGPSLQELIRQEATIGSKVFGPVSDGGSREFYYLGNQVWVWNETTHDLLSKTNTTRRTRYEIRNDVIVKIQDGQQPVYASLDESRNLAKATEIYLELIQKYVYTPIVSTR